MFLQQHKKVFEINHHHKIICDALEKVLKGEIKNLIINIPPRYSKTELVVKSFVSWCYSKNPKSNFIHLSYSDRLVLDNSSEIREIIKSSWYQSLWGVDFKKDSDAKNKWKTNQGGMFYAAPTGGQITGIGAGAPDQADEKVNYQWLEPYRELFETNIDRVDNVFSGAIIIDDPIKPEDAESEQVRNKINMRLLNTIMSRRNSPKKTPIIIIMQRLHEDDMTGFCLDGNTGEHWHHLKMPALKDGKALWSTKHTVEQLEAMRKADPYSFSGQYDQNPSPPEGILFKRSSWKIVDALPANAQCVRGWDLAATTKVTSAYTVGVKMYYHEGNFYVADCSSIKGTPNEVEQHVLNLAKMDGQQCRISLPLDPGAAGKTVALNYSRLLAGFIFECTPETGSKEDRARPFSAQCEAGNVYLLKGDWNKGYIEEHAAFPNGKFKDKVDATSRAFAHLTAKRVGTFTKSSNTHKIKKDYLTGDDW